MKIVSYYPYFGASLNDEVFKNKNSWEYHLKALLKKENIEIHTYDKVPVNKCDYVLFFDNMFYQNVDKMMELYNAKKLDKSVYLNHEYISGQAKSHDTVSMENLANIFSKIVTFDDDLVDDNKFIKGNVVNFFGEELEYKNDFKKRKFITMITNNTSVSSIIRILNIYNYTDFYDETNVVSDSYPIYEEKDKIASYFMKKCSNDFDLYGNYWDSKYKKVLKGSVPREDKINTLSKYKFAICFESYTNQNGYISEKIFDCFKAKTIPIYLGANNIYDYIPRDCFINFSDFSSYDELYNYLINMDSDTYKKYIDSMENFLKSSQFRDNFSSEAIALIIKDALLSNNKISYDDALESINYFNSNKEILDSNRVYPFNIKHVDYDNKILNVEFHVPNNTKLRVVSNGLEYENVEIVVSEDNHFFIDLDYSNKNLYIKIFDVDRNCYVKFYDIDKDKSEEYGLLMSERNYKLEYYNYTEMGIIGRFISLFRNK